MARNKTGLKDYVRLCKNVRVHLTLHTYKKQIATNQVRHNMHWCPLKVWGTLNEKITSICISLGWIVTRL